LPPVPTTYSNVNFKVGVTDTSNSTLNSGVYFGVSDASKAFDGNVFSRVDNNDKTCEIGMAFKEGYAGSVEQVKFFINYINNRAQYADNLVFEGYNVASPTDAQVTFLFNVTESVHEGWNYHDFASGSYPNFRYYRMRSYGKANGGC